MTLAIVLWIVASHANNEKGNIMFTHAFVHDLAHAIDGSRVCRTFKLGLKLDWLSKSKVHDRLRQCQGAMVLLMLIQSMFVLQARSKQAVSCVHVCF